MVAAARCASWPYAVMQLRSVGPANGKRAADGDGLATAAEKKPRTEPGADAAPPAAAAPAAGGKKRGRPAGGAAPAQPKPAKPAKGAKAAAPAAAAAAAAAPAEPAAQVGSGRQAAQRAVSYRDAGVRHASADELVAVKEVPSADSEAAALELLGGARACRRAHSSTTIGSGDSGCQVPPLVVPSQQLRPWSGAVRVPARPSPNTAVHHQACGPQARTPRSGPQLQGVAAQADGPGRARRARQHAAARAPGLWRRRALLLRRACGG